MTSNDLFLDAFGGKPTDKEAAQGKAQGPDARERLFVDTFGKAARQELPEPHLGQTWRLNLAKASKLSFAEKYALGEYENVPYRQLPAWIIDGGYAIASQDEAKYQKKAFSETGLNQSERNLVFDAAQADIEALAAMTQSEVLRDSAVLDGEINAMKARYGNELLGMLNEVNPEAASYINARQKTQAAEKRAAEEISTEDQTRADIKTAQEAIAQLRADAVNRGADAGE